MVVPRNGRASGQVVVVGARNDLCATVGSLKTSDGDALPPDAIRLRYARRKSDVRPVKTRNPNSDPHGLGELYANYPYYDILLDAPPPDGGLVPVWTTVSAPANAKPGVYTGTLRIADAAVPVRVEVAAWRCPPPRDWTTHVGLIHSPESLAMQYGVAEYSEEHWRLIEESLRFMGELGNDDLFLVAIPKNHFGQTHPMIRFRKSDTGALTADFSLVDRYLDLYAALVGEPHAVIAYVWDPRIKRIKRLRRPDRRYRGQPVSVVQSDGSIELEEVPLFGEEGSEPMWRSVMDGIRDRVVERGWNEQSIVVGCAADQRPTAEEIGFFERIAPYARWAIWTHGRSDPPPEGDRLVIDGMEIGHYAHPYCPDMTYPRENGILGGWNLEYPVYTNPRKFIFQYSPLSQYRNFAEGTVLTGGIRYKRRCHGASGFVRIGLDFWDVDDGQPLLTKWDGNVWGNFYRGSPTAVLAPGPDGPVGTVRFEMLREGIQECEARIHIEKALVEKRIPGDLAQRCISLLKERIRIREKDGSFQPGHGARTKGPEDRLWGIAPDWQDGSARLFDLAAEVEGATKR